MRRSLVLFFPVLFGGMVAAQEKLGIVNSNYSPTHSIFLNPSSSADSRAYFQLKLVGVNAYAMTNFGYLPKVSVWSYRKTGELPLPVYSETKMQKFVLLNAAGEGPCFTVSRNNFGAGFHVRARSVFNVRRMPHQLTSLVLSQEPVGPNTGPIEVRRAGFNNMSWVQAGVNFSYIVSKRAEHMVQIGTNLNYLIGYYLLYGNIRNLEGFYNDSLISVNNVDARLITSSPVFNSGRGYSADLGFTYKKMLEAVDHYLPNSKRSNCRYVDYKYKLGISLRDAGFIRYRQGMSTREFSGSGHVSVIQEQGDFTRIPSGSVNFRETVNPVLALLPVSLSGQFDYNFENHIYLAAVVVKNLVPVNAVGVQSPDLISVIPRVEFRSIEAAMPVTLQRYLYPQIGFAFRLRTIVVGVDNIFPLFVKTNIRSMGVYASLGVSLFRHPGCRTKPRAVDDCMPRSKSKGPKKPGLIKRILSSGKTYRK